MTCWHDQLSGMVIGTKQHSLPHQQGKIYIICELLTFSCHCLWWQLGTTKGKKGWTHGIVNGRWGISSVSCCNHTINHTILSGYWSFRCLSYEQWWYSLSITTCSFNTQNFTFFSAFFFLFNKKLRILNFTLFFQCHSVTIEAFYSMVKQFNSPSLRGEKMHSNFKNKKQVSNS